MMPLVLTVALLATNSTAKTYDVVIYGSSPAAISAAVQAKRMGKTAVIVSPETRIGGLTTGGLGQTDIGNKSAFGGIALEFYCDVAAYYRDAGNWKWQKRSDYLTGGQNLNVKDDAAMWTFEPSAALKILEGWEKRDRLEIVRGERLDRGPGGVVKKDGKIMSIRTLLGKTYAGRMFVDATYEGDLMAAAGVSYTVGREANTVYGETINGIEVRCAKHHQFVPGVDPYVVKGDSSSGLLPGVEPYDPNERDGDGDRRVQAYCFRMCLTDVPANRIPFAKPAGYDARDYELLLRNFEAGETGIPWINLPMPNRKTDANNRWAFSTDFIGGNWAWPEATYEERARIFAAHLKYQRGLMWTLANHPRVPEKVRAEVSKWGTCKDEFADGSGDGWQSQLYVREARRMIGTYVMTEHNCRGDVSAPFPIAMGAYTMDSHNVRRRVGADGFVHNEGNVEDRQRYSDFGPNAALARRDVFLKPYGIGYGAIVPKRDECANLFVPVCLSASHMAYGSIRMEPVFFALGQVVGTAAAQAIDAGVAVQDVAYEPLARRLVADGHVVGRSDVRVSDFGFDASDATEIVQKALDCGASRIVLDKRPEPWIVRPLFVRSNCEIVFEDGVELLAKRGSFLGVMDTLVTLQSVSNVVLRGLGRGATCRMWGDDYRKPPYKPAEWRHALNLLSVRQVTVSNLTFCASGGDGIYLGEKRGPNVGVVIADCTCDANHRQGISVITARHLLIERTVLKNTRGADPQSGIDLEPNGRGQELVDCVLRKCEIAQNAHAGCWLNLNHFTRETKPVSVTLEDCRLSDNGGTAFMLNLSSSLPAEHLPTGGFVRVKNCTMKGGGPATCFANKCRGSIDVVFENCLFDRCCAAHPKSPDVSFIVANRQGAYDDGIAFRDVTIRQARSRDWFGALNRPWIDPPTDLSGMVTIISPDGKRREEINTDWIRRRFRKSLGEGFDFTHMGADPAVARLIDHAPGRVVSISPLKFRTAFQIWFYADSPREVVVRAEQGVIGSRTPVSGKIPVLSAEGRTVAEVAVPGLQPTDLRFTVPAAGFYKMAFDTKGNWMKFLSTDVPLGIVPGKALDVFRSSGSLFFRHARPNPSVLFVGGGGGEYAAVKVTGPAGKTLFDDPALDQWGFVNVGGPASDELYRIDLNRPDGFNWEDTYVDLRGEPAVFFLSAEKHW